MKFTKRLCLTSLCVAATCSINVKALSGADKIDIRLVNLLSNYGFEEGSDLAPVDWNFVNAHESAKGSWPEKDGVNGGKCLKIESLTGLSYGWWKTAYSIILEPGKTYVVGGMRRGDKASVKVQGFPVIFDSKNGKYERSIDKPFSTEHRLEASKDWQAFETTFSAPASGSPIWAEIMLQCGDSKKQAYFDDVYLAGDTLKLIEPEVPQLLTPSASLNLTVAACDYRSVPIRDVSGWNIYADNIKLDIESSEFDAASLLWKLKVKTPEKTGTYSLKIEIDKKKNFPNTILKPKFLSVNQGENKFFAFAVFSDTHIYSNSDDNPQNKLFLNVISAINGLSPLFTIGTGDLRGISSGYDDARIKYMCDSYRRLASLIKSPVYNIGGNHDFDKTDSSSQCRWYFSRYMGFPLHFSFDVANFHFVGIDANTVGIYGNDHLGSFHLPGQREWLEKDLSDAASKGKFTVLFFHETLYEGAQFLQDENKKALEDIIFKNDVRLVLEGHNHHNWIYAKRNPLKQGDSKLKEINANPDKDAINADICAYYEEPLFTVFEQTTTASAFLIREAKYFGFRYFVVRDGKIIYDDSIPESFKVLMNEDKTDGKAIEISTGPEKPLKQLPFKITMSPGKYKISVDGADVPFTEVANGDRIELWIFIDMKPGEKKKIEVLRELQK